MLRVTVLAATLLAGCGTGGQTSTVSGNVTYDGQAVASGEITFSPADGKGPIASGSISAGQYSVTDLVPGPKVVLISSVAEVPRVMSTEELQKAAEKGIRAPAPAAQLVPPDAEGNGQTIEIKPGSQQLEFTLKVPPRR
jgi:hypothetical protein